MISAHIPLQKPHSTISGYSRNGQWYATLEYDEYVNTCNPIEIVFTERQLKLHERQALEALDAEAKLDRPAIDVKKAKKCLKKL